jgi:hypothetical protein
VQGQENDEASALASEEEDDDDDAEQAEGRQYVDNDEDESVDGDFGTSHMPA